MRSGCGDGAAGASLLSPDKLDEVQGMSANTSRAGIKVGLVALVHIAHLPGDVKRLSRRFAHLLFLGPTVVIPGRGGGFMPSPR
jgi:hypothetical protein